MIGSSQYECGMKSDGLCSIGVGELPNQSIMALNTRVAASVDFASVPYGMGVRLDNNGFKCGHRVPQFPPFNNDCHNCREHKPGLHHNTVWPKVV